MSAIHDSFLERLTDGQLPAAVTSITPQSVGLSSEDLVQLFETQATSRLLDLTTRKLAKERKTFYSIGSSGHEGNAAIARVFRKTDMAFLHYRSGSFLIERARKHPGATPIWDMALSFAASAEDPISGGRHKVIGSKPLYIPPQTSTIASHLPKAVGAAFSIPLARTIKLEGAELPSDSVVLCSFGDASSNHSTAQGAINAAAWTAYRNLPLPLIFVCEDNGLGISVPTPDGWIQQNYANRPGLEYVYGDGRDVLDALRAAIEAERLARIHKKPVFLHLRTVRLMGHAGSDTETVYRHNDSVEADLAQDPLLHTARHLMSHTGLSKDDLLAIYSRIKDQVSHVMDAATLRPRLETAAEIVAPLTPPRKANVQVNHNPKLNSREADKAVHLSKMISLTLAEQMQNKPGIVVFGEDVGKKGGVYGATTKLQQQFGPARVFDTLLDEQTILGMAIGLAHNGFLPIPEIQFLAYVHNAEDQIRGEAATLSFFSDGQYTNPMVIRIAGLGYQKGFGGHFHNDNSLNVFRDIPGLIMACPSNAADACAMMREAVRLSEEEQRVVIFVEPIALYVTKDLHSDGDGLMTAKLSDVTEPVKLSDIAVYQSDNGSDEACDIAIITYGNGTYMSRRCTQRLSAEGLTSRVIDMRWLLPLPLEAILTAIKGAKSILIVDECRKTGSVAEELMSRLHESDVVQPMARLNGEDCFIPLGPAADEVLISEAQIEEAIFLLAQGKG